MNDLKVETKVKKGSKAMNDQSLDSIKPCHTHRSFDRLRVCLSDDNTRKNQIRERPADVIRGCKRGLELECTRVWRMMRKREEKKKIQNRFFPRIALATYWKRMLFVELMCLTLKFWSRENCRINSSV